MFHQKLIQSHLVNPYIPQHKISHAPVSCSISLENRRWTEPLDVLAGATCGRRSSTSCCLYYFLY